MIENLTDTSEVNALWGNLTGHLVFDIGANGGYLSEDLARRFSHVVAVEPCDESWVYLADRAERIDNLTALHKAVSDHTGTVTLGVKRFTESLGELFTGNSLSHWGYDQGKRTIPCVTLDELSREYGWPDFVKIDTEGHEAYIVDGGHKTLNRYNMRFVIEIHDVRWGDYIQAYFKDVGKKYEIVRHEAYRPGTPNWGNHYWMVNI